MATEREHSERKHLIPEGPIAFIQTANQFWSDDSGMQTCFEGYVPLYLNVYSEQTEEEHQSKAHFIWSLARRIRESVEVKFPDKARAFETPLLLMAADRAPEGSPEKNFFADVGINRVDEDGVVIDHPMVGRARAIHDRPKTVLEREIEQSSRIKEEFEFEESDSDDKIRIHLPSYVRRRIELMEGTMNEELYRLVTNVTEGNIVELYPGIYQEPVDREKLVVALHQSAMSIIGYAALLNQKELYKVAAEYMRSAYVYAKPAILNEAMYGVSYINTLNRYILNEPSDLTENEWITDQIPAIQEALGRIIFWKNHLIYKTGYEIAICMGINIDTNSTDTLFGDATRISDLDTWLPVLKEHQRFYRGYTLAPKEDGYLVDLEGNLATYSPEVDTLNESEKWARYILGERLGIKFV